MNEVEQSPLDFTSLKQSALSPPLPGERRGKNMQTQCQSH